MAKYFDNAVTRQGPDEASLRLMQAPLPFWSIFYFIKLLLVAGCLISRLILSTREPGIYPASTRIITTMNGDKDGQWLPVGSDVPVTTTLVTTLPVTTTVLVTTVLKMTPMTLPVLIPWGLGLGVEQGPFRQSQGYEWSKFDTITQESWLLAPGPSRESQYKYQPPHETGTHPQRKEEQMGMEERLAHME
ncbi:UNVERIFIED_CONTAM: hypothetical protein K2H54_055083 [Gekko kuhli]